MKIFNFKKIAMMGMAAMMTVSTVGMNAFAATETDPLVAKINDNGETVLEVHESDIDNGAYSVDYNGVTITIGEIDDDVMSSSTASVASVASVTTGSFKSQKPTSSKTITATESCTYTFKVEKGNTVYTPNYHIPGANCNNITYAITGDKSYGSKVYASVYWSLGDSDPMSVDLNPGTHYVNLSGLISGSTSYASVKNESYTSTATGVCNVTT